MGLIHWLLSHPPLSKQSLRPSQTPALLPLLSDHMELARVRPQIYSTHRFTGKDTAAPSHSAGRPSPGRCHRRHLHGRPSSISRNDALQSQMLLKFSSGLRAENDTHSNSSPLLSSIPTTFHLERHMENPHWHHVSSNLKRPRDIHITNSICI